MIERFLKQTQFTSQEDYEKNLEFIIPEQFNFAYDVMDEWAKEKPENLPCYGQTTRESVSASHSMISKNRATEQLHISCSWASARETW